MMREEENSETDPQCSTNYYDHGQLQDQDLGRGGDKEKVVFQLGPGRGSCLHDFLGEEAAIKRQLSEGRTRQICY